MLEFNDKKGEQVFNELSYDQKLALARKTNDDNVIAEITFIPNRKWKTIHKKNRRKLFSVMGDYYD